MLKSFSRLSAIIGATLLSGVLWAYPALMGFSGLSSLPDAGTNLPQSVDVALDTQDNSSGITKSWRVVYGVAEGLEIGAAFVDTSRETFAGTLKYQLDSQPSQTTSIGLLAAQTSEITIMLTPPVTESEQAVPVKFAAPPSFTLPVTMSYQAYLVHSRLLSEESADYPSLTGTVGINWTAMKGHGIDMQAFRPFFGAEAGFKRMSILADCQFADDKMDHKPMVSVAARYSLDDKVKLQFGYTNALGVLGGNTKRVFMGVNYKFAAK